MKRFTAWVCVLALCLLLGSCGLSTENEQETSSPSEQCSTTTQATTTTTRPSDEQEDAPADNDNTEDANAATPLLYRVTDEDGDRIWLFGSIHVGRDSYYPLPTYVLDAFEQADGLAVELDIVAFEKDMGAQMNVLSYLVYQDGTTIGDVIPEDLYESSVAILKEYNSYIAILERYCPAFWSNTIDSLMMEELGGDVELGIDRHLIHMAYEAEKPIEDIESAEFQYRMLGGFDATIQTMMLESSVYSYENQEEAKANLEEMMDVWASGDEERFNAYLHQTDDTLTAEEQEALDEYNRIMVYERNLTMADYAEDALENGDEMFICVGAAHVVGDDALADILAERGYTVECVTA